MKTKILLTVLFSVGIIGITSAQGFAKNDFSGGPRQTEMVKLHHDQMQTRKDVRKVESDRRISRHEKKKIQRMEKKHRRYIARHHRHF